MSEPSAPQPPAPAGPAGSAAPVDPATSEENGVPVPGRLIRASRWLSREILLPVVLALIVIQFVIQAFRIPSQSMEDSLLVGDFLLGLKFTYGAPIPFSEKKLPGFSDPKAGDILIFRYPGEPAYPDYDRERYSHVANLLMLGNFFWDSQPEPGQEHLVHYFMGPKDFIKRCVATSGQTLEVRNGQLFVNGDPQSLPGHGKYTDSSRQPGIRDQFGPLRIPVAGERINLDSLGIVERYMVRSLILQENPEATVTFDLALLRDGVPVPHHKFEEFRFELQQHKSTLVGEALQRYLPYSLRLGDTLAVPLEFGMLRDQARTGFISQEVPELKGGWFGLVDKLSRTVAYSNFDATQLGDLAANIARMDERDTAHAWSLRAQVQIDGQPIHDYALKQDAYFMMGDNRDNSSDGRYWGMLSRNNVKAKAFITYFSFDNDDGRFAFGNPLSWFSVPFKIRWSRIGKLIHGV